MIFCAKLSRRNFRSIGRNACGATGTSKRFSGSFTPTAEQSKFLKSEAVKASSSVNLFPWTSAQPESRHPLRRLYCMFRQNMSQRALRDLTYHDIMKNIAINSIESGALEAMQCVSMGIFRHKRMRDNYIDISSKYKKADEGILQEMQDDSSDVDMSTIFDKKLEDFYLYAIQSHCLNADRLCAYSMHSVSEARIVNVAYFVSSRRDGTTPPHSYQLSFFDVNIFIDESQIDLSSLQTMYTDFETLCIEQLDSQQDSTVRVKVDVDCTELFAITNAVSGDLLQGSFEPQEVTHQLILENYVDGKTGELAGNWTIVDIDNWLQGNEFWAKAKIHHKREEEDE